MGDQFGFAFGSEARVPTRVPLFRLSREIGPGVVESFYTASVEERDEASTKNGYAPASVACAVYDRQAPGTVPLIRLWHGPSRRHAYTAHPDNLAAALARGTYRNEGVTGYVFAEKGEPGTVPLYSLVHRASNVHLYTTDEADRDAAVATGFEAFGVACWVFPASSVD